MIAQPLVLALVVLGHGCLTLLLINCSHGLGLRSRLLKRATLVFLAGSGLLLLAGVWWLGELPLTDWPWPARVYGAACLAVALLGLPGVTLVRARRRPPPGVVERSVVLDYGRAANGAPPPIGQGFGALLLRLPGNESLRLKVHDLTVDWPDLPPALDGLSVLHLSDLHFTRAFDQTFFESVARDAARLPADLVLFTGDLIDDPACIPWIEPVLGALRGRLGQFAILGNHDYQAGHQPIAQALDAAGFDLLEGRWKQLEASGATLALGGTSAPWGPDLDLAARPAAELALLLCHTPDRFYRVAAAGGVNLMFSGHNHGGQVRLPVLGPVLMPSLYSRRFDLGFFEARETLLYVSRGVSAEYPLRYRCLPEIARLTFRRGPVPGHAVAPLRRRPRNESQALRNGVSSPLGNP